MVGIPKYPYARVFDPVAQVGHNLRMIGAGKGSLAKKFFVVEHVEPIQPFVVDFTGSDFYGSAIPANGTTGYDTQFYEMDDEMEMPDRVLAQFRILCLDDLLLLIGHDAARNILYDTKKTTTYVSKHKPRHNVFERTTSINTESLLWLVSNNTEAGRRIARIVRIWLDNESASAGIVRFGDGDGTGTDANAANADMSFEIGAIESIGFGEDEIPLKEFFTGITWQTSVQPLRVSITVEEDNEVPFEFQQSAEIFVWEDDVPYFRPVNPVEQIALAAARILLYGYKLLVKELEKKPEKWTDVPVAMMPRA